MKPASAPRSTRDLRIVVADSRSGAITFVPSSALSRLFEPGDLVVVNDAATLPASLFAETEVDGAPAQVELRLLSWIDDRRWTVALLGSGDYRTRTEDRAAPPVLAAGARLTMAGGLVATVQGTHPESPRLVDVEFTAAGGEALADVWAALYQVGHPVQYAHVPAPLALWDVQNVYAGRPWAVEMPSAGRAFRAETLIALRLRGVEVATVTHAAGLSSVGDAAIDARLPFPERYEVPESTEQAIARARSRGGRVVAIGTSVVRALESAARSGKDAGVTDLLLGPGSTRLVVDAVLTGVHDVETSHFRLLRAFAERELLEEVERRAEREGLLGHELGDACLVWGQARDKRAHAAPASQW